jgi:5'-nucleotidase (lipoprotein e(P4) family)
MNSWNRVDWTRAAIALVAVSTATACSDIDMRSKAVDAGALQWVRGSVEAAALYVQTYRLAAREVAGQRGSKASSCAASREKPWGVVLDIDETVLNNSAWRVELAQRGQQYSEAGWDAWVRTQRATALPGAQQFTLGVKELCGHVVFVTNRSEDVCDDTRRNLRAQGLPYDAVICATRGKDKQQRFEEIRGGRAVPGMVALEILAFVGDNIQDFPAWTQTSCHSLAELERDFGTRYFLLPNPVYGSWQSTERDGPNACTLTR